MSHRVQYIEHVEGLWDRAYGISSLSKKTRKTNHLQMSLQRQYFSTQLFKDNECWSGQSLESNPLHSSLVTSSDYINNNNINNNNNNNNLLWLGYYYY